MTGPSRWVGGWWPIPAITGMIAGVALAVLSFSGQAGRTVMPAAVLLPAAASVTTSAPVTVTAPPTATSPSSATAAPTKSPTTEATTTPAEPAVRVVPPRHPVLEQPDDSAGSEQDGGG